MDIPRGIGRYDHHQGNHHRRTRNASPGHLCRPKTPSCAVSRPHREPRSGLCTAPTGVERRLGDRNAGGSTAGKAATREFSCRRLELRERCRTLCRTDLSDSGWLVRFSVPAAPAGARMIDFPLRQLRLRGRGAGLKTPSASDSDVVFQMERGSCPPSPCQV